MISSVIVTGIGKIQIMGQNGKKTVKEHYSRRKLAKDYMEIMEQVRE
mgnify:CR=1 FL=1